MTLLEKYHARKFTGIRKNGSVNTFDLWNPKGYLIGVLNNEHVANTIVNGMNEIEETKDKLRRRNLLIKEMRTSKVNLEKALGIWISDLIEKGKLTENDLPFYQLKLYKNA